MSYSDLIPIEEPTDEARTEPRKPKMPNGQKKGTDTWGLALTAREPAPNCPIRCIDDIPAKFRKPLKPPVKKVAP